MLAGRKRRHEDQHQGVPKRSKNISLIGNRPSSTSTDPSPSVVTRVFGYCSRWFQNIMSRRSRNSNHHQSSSTHHQPSSTHQRRSLSSQTDENIITSTVPNYKVHVSNSKTYIVIDDEEDNTGGVYKDMMPSTTVPSNLTHPTRHNRHGYNSHRHGNHRLGDNRHGHPRNSSKHSNKGSSKVLERIAKEKNDEMFQDLLVSTSRMGISSSNSSTHVQQQDSALLSHFSNPDSIGSLSSTSSPQFISYNADLHSFKSPPSSGHSSIPKIFTPTFLSLSNEGGRSPVPHLYTPSHLESSLRYSSKQTISPKETHPHFLHSPPHFTTTTSSSPILHTTQFDSSTTSPRSSSSVCEDVPCKTFPQSPPSNIEEAFKDKFPWLDYISQKVSAFTDAKSRIEAQEKYTKIHQQQRMDADDKRNKNQSERIRNLTSIRIWNPHMEDEVDEELVLELPADLSAEVNDIWSYGPLSEVFVERNNIRITRADLLTLKGLEWLNDEIINFYLTMVIDTVNSSGERKVHLFNSFFYPKLMSKGYTGVRRWTKKVDIFSYDLILLPVHLGMHWCLASIDLKRKLIHYYDSLRGSNMKCLHGLRDYLVSEAMDKKQMEYDVSEFKLECRTDIPDQHNGSDCGVFTCMYARHLAYDKEMNFCQDDLAAVRRMMVAEIISNELLRNR